MREATAPTAASPRPSTARIPRTMSTQHPDNVAMPFFSQAATLTAEDEVREAYYAFSHLGCDEQMWDNEGKEVDAHVVEKLLTSYESYFAEHPIGESVFLTPRIPNPALEPTQAKIVLEVLQSLPRHADIARVFYGRERPPILELIYPMATSARDLDRVREYYERFVSAMEHVTLAPDDLPMGTWFGRFAPKSVRSRHTPPPSPSPSYRRSSTTTRPRTSAQASRRSPRTCARRRFRSDASLARRRCSTGSSCATRPKSRSSPAW